MIDGPDNDAGRKRVCVVTTSVLIVKFFLIPHLRRLSSRYEVTLVVNTDDTALLAGYSLDVRVIPLAIERRIAPWLDLRALAALRRLFVHERFDAVHSYSPKGGLLAMLAARLSGVPVRIHTFTGQVWANRTGAMRLLLKTADRVTARCANLVLVDSISQRDFIRREGVIPPSRRCEVPGGGSISGVNLNRFKPDPEARRRVRRDLGVSDDAVLLVYAGRLTRDKGVLDLARAFATVAFRNPALHLVLVGPDEENVTPGIRSIAGDHADRLRFHDYTPAPERFLAAAEILCLPSYREGFGVVIIEAAACGVPAVASRIYGITDAVVEGETGLLHEPGNVGELAGLLGRLAADPASRERLGRAARQRAERDFSEDRIIGAVLDLYEQAFGQSRGPAVLSGRKR
jgi:glycosyltransferase involved in cell wall biosynthesis